MSNKPPLGLRPRWLVLSDRADEIKAAVQRYEAQGLLCPDEWLIELQDIKRQQAILNPPQPEPDCEPVVTPPAAEIPEPIRTGAAPFYVLVVSDDNPRGPGGEPIVWEHPFPHQTTLEAALWRRATIGSRYGTTFIAECRIMPVLTREVPADA